MWQKLTSFILSNLIPASILTTQSFTSIPAPPPLEIEVAPLAVLISEEISEPVIDARAALVIETHSNEALLAENVWKSLPIASLTKLMTALVVKERMDLDQVITVSSLVNKVRGSNMGLQEGEKISIRNLLKGLLINSGNDAAMILSEVVGGSPEAFVELMNQRTLSLGLHQTVFVDPTGLGDGNISSAFEIAHLAKQVFRDPLLQSIMRERESIVHSADGVYIHKLSNTNRLLGTDISERIIAGKTGTTRTAGQCLISFIGHEGGRTTMTILLGSSDRYREVKSLIEWIDETYTWE